jgi:4-aminobutyrate aminotransferase/(S)-3-amino-2-methylpropionate transaminase
MQTEKLYDEYMITSMVPGFDPVEVESAQGTRIRSSSGEEYLDCFSGIAVCNAGHCHPKVIAAAKAQMEKLVHCCTYVYYNPVAGRVAEALADITPGALRKSFLANSGAEAIEGALRLAKHFTGRNEFVALTHSFHGRTYATLSITGNSGRKKSGGPFMPGVVFAPVPYFYRCPFGSKTEAECAERCAEQLAEAIKYQSSGNVAAFVGEPVLGEGGILAPHDSYFRLVKEILDEQGILFICDEVQSGFGRTGKMFAIEHSGVEPEIMTLAKGIADGFPLSAFIARPDIGDAFTPGSHLSTFGGNPVSCAAALANIEVMQEERLPENAAARGDQLMGALTPLEDELALVGEVRGRGLMIGLELVKDADKTPAVDAAKEVKKRCREAGILIGVGGSLANVVRLQPPLVLSEAEAGRIIDTLSKVLTEVNGSL